MTIRRPFLLSLILVLMLWVATPVVARLADSVGLIGVDPESGYGWELSLLLGTTMLYIIYLPAGLLVGLVMLFIRRSIGAGILAGTGLGAVAGFLTCLAILEG